MATKQYNAPVATGDEEAMSPQEEMNGTQAIKAEAEGKELSPRLKKEMSGYKTLLTKLIHAPEKQESTMEMLKAGPAAMSVPNAAITLNKQAEEIMKGKGIKISQNTKLAGSVFLVSDLIELGNAGAGWEVPVAEDEAKQIYQDTLQDYIETGVRDKTIDPMELQQSAEPFMNEQQRAVGSQVAQQQGIPMEPNQQQILGNQKGMLRGGK
jgi:hypothetical protein